MHKVKLFLGSSHPALGQAIIERLGIDAAAQTRLRFSNENILYKVDENVRGCDAFVLQTAASPLDKHIVELLIMLDTLRYSGAEHVCAILPYFPYVRSDKMDRPGVCITARLMAQLIQSAGATHAILLDLHAAQEQAFFNIPTDALTATGIFVRYLLEEKPINPVLVAPDAGEVKDLLRFAERLKYPMAVIDKRRFDDSENPKAFGIIGDVRGKTAILVDDEIASASTIASSAQFLHQQGAARVWALATHAVFSGNAVEKLEKAPIERVVVTDSLPILPEKHMEKLRILSIAELLSRAITQFHRREDISLSLDY
ncbi:MAG: ribose-phosphate pyrophosphokinase [Bradymonadales bacterium]|jgi:ribose-phosphate pyrophosphokinase